MKTTDKNKFDEIYFLPREELMSNMRKQKVSILDAILEHYESGAIEDPVKNHKFMNLLACVCEGKIVGKSSKEKKVVWRLSGDSEEKEKNFRKKLMVGLSELISNPSQPGDKSKDDK